MDASLTVRMLRQPTLAIPLIPFPLSRPKRAGAGGELCKIIRRRRAAARRYASCAYACEKFGPSGENKVRRAPFGTILAIYMNLTPTLPEPYPHPTWSGCCRN